METKDEKDILLGFLSLFESANKDGKLGAILITDGWGVPQEFRCTHPVKPTAIQRPLYGNTLEPHIGIQLCGIPLIQSIHLKPDIIIVDKEFLLNVRHESPHPVIYLYRAGETLEIEPSDSTKNTVKRNRIECPTGKFQPVIIKSHPEYDEDRDMATKVIEEIFVRLDPSEPFDRMQKAIEVLGKQDNRFQ